MDGASFWTMAGTLVALGLGIYPHWIGWFKRPALSLDFNGAVKASGPILLTFKHSRVYQEKCFYIRIPVLNRVGRMNTSDVEVWLDELWLIENGQKHPVIPYLPLRFEWSHTNCVYASGPVPGGSRRLLNIGFVNPRDATLKLDTEFPHFLKQGKYEVVLQISCPVTHPVDSRFEIDFSIPPKGVNDSTTACNLFNLTFLG